MQVLPLIGFYWRRNQQLSSLLAQGQSNDSHIVIDVASMVVPLLKKYYPALNSDGLLDDLLTTLKEVFATTPTAPAQGDYTPTSQG